MGIHAVIVLLIQGGEQEGKAWHGKKAASVQRILDTLFQSYGVGWRFFPRTLYPISTTIRLSVTFGVSRFPLCLVVAMTANESDSCHCDHDEIWQPNDQRDWQDSGHDTDQLLTLLYFLT